MDSEDPFRMISQGSCYQLSCENIKMCFIKSDSVDLIYNRRFYIQCEVRI